MNKRELYINNVLELKDEILDLKEKVNYINFLIIPVIEDIENIESLLQSIDQNSNWLIIDSMIEEVEALLINLNTLLEGSIEDELTIFEKPVNDSSKILYHLIYKTNKFVKNSYINPITQKLRNK